MKWVATCGYANTTTGFLMKDEFAVASAEAHPRLLWFFGSSAAAQAHETRKERICNSASTRGTTASVILRNGTKETNSHWPRNFSVGMCGATKRDRTL